MKLSRDKILALIIVVAVLACGIAIWSSWGPAPKFRGPLEKVVLGTCPIEQSTLLWVAEDKGYFTESGLDVTIKSYSSGFLAVKDLQEDKVEIATAAEFVLTGRSLSREDFKILASIDRVDDIQVIARKDHGIVQVSDLKGKRIGLRLGSTAEFFLGRFLTFNNISGQDVRMVDLSPPEQLEAIKNREIDAVIVWEPTAHKIQELLGPKGVKWPGQSGQGYYWVLVCKDELIRKRPSVIQRFLSAMLLAEDFVASNESRAKAVVARRLDWQKSYVDSVWRHHAITVGLDQPLILAMEDQARWLLSKDQRKRNRIPNYLDFVYFDGLKALKPGAISIIHRGGADDRQK